MTELQKLLSDIPRLKEELDFIREFVVLERLALQYNVEYVQENVTFCDKYAEFSCDSTLMHLSSTIVQPMHPIHVTANATPNTYITIYDENDIESNSLYYRTHTSGHGEMITLKRYDCGSTEGLAEAIFDLSLQYSDDIIIYAALVYSTIYKELLGTKNMLLIKADQGELLNPKSKKAFFSYVDKLRELIDEKVTA